MPKTGGVFGKTKSWTSSILKNIAKVTNQGKKPAMFIWRDELGLHRTGTPEMEKIFDENLSLNKEASDKDLLSLANGTVSLNVGEDAIASYVEDLPVELLPCPVNYMNQLEAYKWLERELKKDLIEQGIGPVAKIPWGKVKIWQSAFI